MHILKTTGRNASVAKYDILTALGAHALAGTKHDQKLVLRFITLITARYNWKRNELAVGQREIARLWSVDERTVKREMAKLRAKGWLEVRRQGARGHVTQYRMNSDKLMNDTRAQWANVGPDFDARMQEKPELPENVVPMPVRGTVAVPDISDDTEWSLARAVLHREDAATYGAWFETLIRVSRAGGRLTLKAPGRFHANYVQTHFESLLLRACQEADPEINGVIISAE